MALELPAFLAVFLAGLVSGVVNVVAAGGSFLTLPVLMFAGLPAGVANATNRVGVVLQNLAAVWSFDRHRVLDRGALRWAALPSLGGAVLGTWLALVIDDEAFQRLLAVLMVGVSLWTLAAPQPAAAATPGGDGPRAAGSTSSGGRGRRAALSAAFFGVGIYGGFVQAGVGFFVLALTSAAGLDLVRGNAVKVLAILCFTLLSLAIFAWSGRVAWEVGWVLGAGNVLGGLLGARLTVRKGHRWVRWAVLVTAVVFAVQLLVTP